MCPTEARNHTIEVEKSRRIQRLKQVRQQEKKIAALGRLKAKQAHAKAVSSKISREEAMWEGKKENMVQDLQSFAAKTLSKVGQAQVCTNIFF